MTIEKNDESVFSPFEGNVRDRSYTKPAISQNEVGGEIPEPVYTPPTMGQMQEAMNDKAFENNLGGFGAKPQSNTTSSTSGSGNSSSGGDKVTPPPKAPMQPVNPVMNELEDTEKRKAAQIAVEAAMDGYKGLNKFGNSKIMFNLPKISKMVKEGKVDPRIILEPEPGIKMPLLEYMKTYNANVDGIISVSPEFEKKVKPIMTRVFMKRGIGMSDEGLLAYYFGMDILTKTKLLYDLNKTLKDLTGDIIERSAITLAGSPIASQTSYQPDVTEPQEKRSHPEPDPTPSGGNNSGGEREFIEPQQEISRTFEEPEEKSAVKEEVHHEPISVSTVKERTGSEKVEQPVIVTSKRKSKPPQFGNPEILSDMERVAKKGTTRKRR